MPPGTRLQWIAWQLLPPPLQRRSRSVIALTRRMRARSTPLPGEPPPSLPEGVVELPTRYGSFWFDESDEKLTPWVRRHATWEADLLRLLDAEVRPGMTVVDVGANVGFHTVVLSKLVGDDGRVHAFEPYPVTVEILRANLWRHGCLNTTLYESAVTDFGGHARIEVDPEGASGAHLAATGVEVRATTLDETLGIASIDVLKVDVEGAEPLVLRGATDVLAASPQMLAIVEFRGERHLDGTEPEAVLDEYQAHGFRLELIRPDGRTKPATHDELISAATDAGTVNIALRRAI
jgi:FkbM family methyltransferase